MSDRVCSEPGCGMPHRARGLCNAHYLRMRRQDPAHAAHVRQRYRDYYATHPEYANSKRAAARSKSGMPAVGERREGPCEICNEHADPLHLDHCHISGALRGWLCRGCNTGIGMLRDDWRNLTRAARYLLTRGAGATGD